MAHAPTSTTAAGPARHLPVTFVIRVYRCAPGSPGSPGTLAGVIEAVESGSASSFRTGAELLGHLGLELAPADARLCPAPALPDSNP